MSKPVKVAVIDLNRYTPNQSMRCIKQMLEDVNGLFHGQIIDYYLFDARYKGEVPSMNYDIYLSTGGPGSPYDGEGEAWEDEYFKLMHNIWNYNKGNHESKKYVFFICHSFQLMNRVFELTKVTKRYSTSFGITFVHKTEEGKKEPCFEGLADDFYVADFRDWQCVQPDMKRFAELGAKILTMEKSRPHLNFEQAITAIRLSDEMIGTQFHPEADSKGMLFHFQNPERKKLVIEQYGEEKYNDIIAHLEDPEKINLTYKTVIPNFLRHAVYQLRQEEIERKKAQGEIPSDTPLR